MPVLILAILVGVLAVGCAQPLQHHYPEIDRQAIEMVWWGVYGAGQDQKPPTIVWIDDDELCIPDPEVKQGCKLGWYDTGDNTMHILWRRNYERTNMTIAHELYHAFLRMKGKPASDPGDGAHTDEGWQTIVPYAAKQLGDAGL